MIERDYNSPREIFAVGDDPEGQASIFDQPTVAGASAARDSALAHVEEAADELWKERAYTAVLSTARRLPEFISDDVWDTGGLDSTREDRALGPILQRAAREGVAVKTDRVRPSVRSHMSGKPVWRSLIYEGQ